MKLLQRRIFNHSHPLRMLLYLEWMLLGIVAVSETFRADVFQLQRSPLMNSICLIIFTAMGLILPRGDRWLKLAYTLLEFVLILLMAQIGGVRLMVLLYVVVVMRNCLIFDNGTRTLFTVIAFLLATVTQFQRFSYFRILTGATPDHLAVVGLSVAVLIGLVVLFLQLLVNAVLAERCSREQLAIANAQLREYALKVESIATLQERNRIAREIHDSLGHSLTAFNLHLEAALRLLKSDPEEAIALLQEAKYLGTVALQDVRNSVATLRSEPLQGVSLADAIASLLADFQRSTGLIPDYKIDLNHPISSDLKIALYRITQEALTNICKYAQATSVTIHLQSTGQDIELKIHDNGKGFDPSQTTSGFGLRGMQERTIALGGSFEIITAPHAGCCIVATFPGDPE